MSDIQRQGRQAEHELQLTAEAHDKYRKEQIDKAVALAAQGLKDEAYTKLLMVVAIDGVRAVMQGHVDSATMDKASAEARHPSN